MIQVCFGYHGDRADNFASKSSLLLTTLLALKHQHVRERAIESAVTVDIKELHILYVHTCKAGISSLKIIDGNNTTWTIPRTVYIFTNGIIFIN